MSVQWALLVVLLIPNIQVGCAWLWGCSREDCRWGSWSKWSSCSLQCGGGGMQSRSRRIVQNPSCGGSRCTGPSSEHRPCNRFCNNGGTPILSGCQCLPGVSGGCCEICTRINCTWSEWSPWTTCSAPCGLSGTQTKYRVKAEAVCGGEECDGPATAEQSCNMYCHNGGTPHDTGCYCTPTHHGQCCQIAFDPCETDGHHMLHDHEARRSNHTMLQGAPLCDDYLADGWFRVISPAGGDMINSCPAEGACSTAYPVWMEGDLPPPDGQVHDRSAYINVDGFCQADTLNIRVKNCGDFNVYYLPNVKGCPIAYCFGDKASCPSGQSSPTGHQPGCSDNFPSFDQSPTVDYAVSTTGKREVLFRCNISNTAAFIGDMWVDIRWFIQDEEVLRVSELNVTQLPHHLREEDWYHGQPDALGKEVYCRVRADGTKYDVPSPERESNRFFAGIQLQNLHLTVYEGESVETELEPTIPILGSTFVREMAVEIITPTLEDDSCISKGFYTGLKVEEIQDGKIVKCNVTIKAIARGEPWQSGTKGILGVHAPRDKIDGNPNRNMKVMLQTSERVPSHKIWQKYRLPDITVTVVDSRRSSIQSAGVCLSLNDPHMTTFDGCIYDNYLTGEFILYRHKTLPLQVNAYYVRCNKIASCNCAVFVKSGKDLFAINYCPSVKQKFSAYVQCPDGSLTVISTGSYSYKITLPTGTMVSVNGIGTSYGFIRGVTIRAVDRDEYETEGLCGSYNGNKKDDLNHTITCDRKRTSKQAERFSKSWRIASDHEDSLWTGTKGPDRELVKFCGCKQGNKITCEYQQMNEECIKWGKDVTVRQKNRCSVQSQSLSVFGSNGSDYSDVFPPPPPPPADTGYNEDANFTNGWTQESAEAFCWENILGTPSGRQCSTMDGVDFEYFIETCVQDIQIGGNTEWYTAALEAMQEKCNFEASTNMSRWVNDGGKLKPPPDITNTLCPGNCSNHGVCEERRCVCDPDYGEIDCSIDLIRPPNVTSVPDSGKCDLRRRPCKATPLHGENFIDSDNLTCRVRYWQLGNSGLERVSVTSFQTGVYMHALEVMCPLYEDQAPGTLRLYNADNPLALVYKVAVSNDAGNYSTENTVMAFDGKCLDCDTQSVNCTLKSNTCRISGMCYIAKEMNPFDPCASCEPGRSTSQWIIQEVASCRIDGACVTDGTLHVPCHICNTNVTRTEWAVVSGHCFISGECIKAGSFRTETSCDVCDPLQNATTWSKNADCIDAAAPPANNVPIIVAVTLSCMACVCAVAGFTVYTKKLKSRKTKVKPIVEVTDPESKESGTVEHQASSDQRGR